MKTLPTLFAAGAVALGIATPVGAAEDGLFDGFAGYYYRALEGDKWDGGNCVVTYHGATYLDGRCTVKDIGVSSFSVLRGDEVVANVRNYDVEGLDPTVEVVFGGSAHSIGPIERVGDCWFNHLGGVCVWIDGARNRPPASKAECLESWNAEYCAWLEEKGVWLEEAR